MAARVADGSLTRSAARWHPLKPARSAPSLALATASAAGVPAAAAALLARPQDVPLGGRPVLAA